MDTCPICKEYIIRGFTHRCPPKWHYHIIDYMEEEETTAIRARDAQEAAEKACRRLDYHSSEYYIVHKGYGEVIIWDANMQNPVRFDIQAYAEPTYDASTSREALPEWATKLTEFEEVDN